MPSLISSSLATIVLIILIKKIDANYNEIGLLQELPFISILLLGVFFLGICITFFCSYYGIKKFLNLKSDEIY